MTFCFSANLIEFIPLSSIITISPGSISLINSPPTQSKAQLSELSK